METVEFESIIPEEYLPRVTLDEKETELDLFGDNTGFVTRKLEDGVRKLMNDYSQRFHPDPFQLVKILEHRARFGAYIASKNSFRKVWEIGCGSAIPSVAYALLTGKEITAVDISRRYLDEAFELKERFGLANLEIICDDGLRLVEQGHIKPQDKIVICNPHNDFQPFVGSSKVMFRMPNQVIYSAYSTALTDGKGILRDKALSFSYRVNVFARGDYPTESFVLDLERF